jgi:hypothetical protein
MAVENPVRRLLAPALKHARDLARRWQGPGVLPDFLIIGAQKSGTSSLYRYLAQHPQIRASEPKEVHFFDGGLVAGDDAYARGADWYRRHFPPRAALAPGQRVFEASPLYLLHPLAPARIAGLLPQARLIAVLRNPVDRALSHYFHNVRTNDRLQHREDLPPREAMAAEEARLAEVLTRGDYKSQAYRVYSYKARGRYLEQLERFWAHFPRERLLVLRAEDLFADPAAAIGRVLDFLELDRAPATIDFRPQNVGRNRGDVDAAAVAELEAYFAPLNRALAAELGPAFAWEDAPSPRVARTASAG